MKLDKLLLFSGAFLALAIAYHALQDVDKPDAHGTSVEGHYATAKAYWKEIMKYDKLILFSSAFMGLVGCISYFMNVEPESYFATIKAHLKARKWSMEVAEYKIIADARVSDAIAFLQKNDVDSAIEAYKYAAIVTNQIVVMAQKAKLLTEAIKASIQEARLYKLAAKLCEQANDIETSTFFYTCVAAAYERVAGIYKEIAVHYSNRNDSTGKASATLMAAEAYRKSANWFRIASHMEKAITMYELASDACNEAAMIFRAAWNFERAAEVWIQAAEADLLSAQVYRQMDNILLEARMYGMASCHFMSAFHAYTNAYNNDGAIEARQQAAICDMTAAQMYHEAGEHVNEAMEYTTAARRSFTVNKYAQAGTLFELAAEAYLHAQHYHAAINRFQKAEQAYTAAKDSTAVQRVKSMMVTVSIEMLAEPYT